MSNTKIKSNQLEIEAILNDPSALASDVKAGTLRIATQPEVNAGTAADLAVTPLTLATFTDNWMHANLGADFTPGPLSGGTRALAIGESGYALGVDSIAIGTNAYGKLDSSIAIGKSSYGVGVSSVAIGESAVANSYEVQLGYAVNNINTNYLHLHDKGKLEVVGDEAQIVFPNYLVSAGSPVVTLPTGIEGGVIYDGTDKVLKFYDGAEWSKFEGLLTEDVLGNIIGGSGAAPSLSATTALNNFVVGVNAGTSLTTGDYNIILGNEAGKNLVSRLNNILIGYGTASRPDAAQTGSSNVVIGNQSGRVLNSSSASYNTFIGHSVASTDNATGGEAIQRSVGIGSFSLSNLESGNENTVVGSKAAFKLTTGHDNTVVGYGGLYNATTGYNNVAIGRRAARNLSSTSYGNVVIGTEAGPPSGIHNNELYINNAESVTPLIHGNFATVVGSPLLDATVTINGELTVAGQILANDGAAAAPSIAFASNTNSGITQLGANTLYFVTSSQLRFGITSTYLESRNPHYFVSGSAASPSITHNVDSSTGIYFVNPNEVHISTGGVDRLGVLSDGSLSVSGTTNYETLVTDDDDVPNKKYVDDAIGTGIGASTLGQLLDVGINTPVNGELLTYSTAGSPPEWINQPPSVVELNDLVDVALAPSGSPVVISVGDVLTYIGSPPYWSNQAPDTGNNWIHADAGDNFTVAPNSVAGSIAMGEGAEALASNSVAIGTGTDVLPTALQGIAIGRFASSNNDHGVSIGTSTDTGVESVAIGNAAQATSNQCIAIGNDTDAGLSSVAIGDGAQSLGGSSVAIGKLTVASGINTTAIGQDVDATLLNQSTIGSEITTVSTTTDVLYSTKLGYGAADTNKNLLHLFSKGKLELYGDEAQFIFPNYAVGSPATYPASAIEGGVIYDSVAKGLQVYGGSPAGWSAVGGGAASLNELTDVALGSPATAQVLGYNGSNWTNTTLPATKNWLYANDGDDFGTTPIATGANSVAMGNTATTGSTTDSVAIGDATVTGNEGVAIGSNASAAAVAIGIGENASAGGGGLAVGRNANAAGNRAVAVGQSTAAALTQTTSVGFDLTPSQIGQTVIGQRIDSTDTTTDVAYSVKIGAVETAPDKNLLHLFSKGKLELYGDEAQFIIPSHDMTGSPPLAGVEGGLVYDIVTNALQLFGGGSPADWTAVGGGGLENVIEDTSPQLGAALDVNTFNIYNGNATFGARLQLNGAALQLKGSYGSGATAGGGVQILGGDSYSGSAGLVQILGASAPVAGGAVHIQSGNGGTSVGGDMTITAGDSTSSYAGDVTISAGGTTSGTGGKVLVNGGAGGQGDVNIVAGGYGGGHADGGNILIKSGQNSGAGGLVTIQNEGGAAAIAFDAADNITITGDTVSEGSLQIGDGVGSGRSITIQQSGNYNDPFIRFRNNYGGYSTGIILSSPTVGDDTLVIENHNGVSGGYAFTTLTLDRTGNVSLVAGLDAETGSPAAPNVPILASHLTRKDYVDAAVAGGLANPLTADLNTGGHSIISSDSTAGTAADNIAITAGQSIDGAYAAGNVSIYGGQGYSGTYGGSITISGGNEYASGYGGNVLIKGGNDASGGGLVTIRNGNDNAKLVFQNGAVIDATGRLNFTTYSEKPLTYGTTGGQTLNVNNATYFYPTGTTTGSITFTFTAPAANTRVFTFTLEMLGAANNAPVWPGSVTWANGVEPTWTTGTDIVSFFTRDQGTTWYGSAVVLNDATVDLNNADILNARSITFNSEVTITPAGSPATATADWTTGQKQKITITEATTVSFTAPSGQSNLTLKIINGGTGTITWPGTVKWAGGTEPSWTTTGTDIVSFYFDGTDYYGMAGLAFA